MTESQTGDSNRKGLGVSRADDTRAQRRANAATFGYCGLYAESWKLSSAAGLSVLLHATERGAQHTLLHACVRMCMHHAACVRLCVSVVRERERERVHGRVRVRWAIAALSLSGLRGPAPVNARECVRACKGAHACVRVCKLARARVRACLCSLAIAVRSVDEQRVDAEE